MSNSQGSKISWPETRIENWAELQEVMDSLSGTCAFRGQGSQGWRLVSSFNRIAQKVEEADAIKWELFSILRFRSEAHAFIPVSVIPPNPFKLKALDTYVEWLMIMQHYGAPTRLLDWSLSPYVAIYFAVIDPCAEDAAIWYFASDPVNAALSQRLGRKVGELLDFADFRATKIRNVGDDFLLYFAMKKFRTVREVAQQGVFTFANRLIADQQDVIAQTCAGHAFGRVIIPHQLKSEFCARLALMNVTAASLFPGIEGVCWSIRDSLRLAAANLPSNVPTATTPTITSKS